MHRPMLTRPSRNIAGNHVVRFMASGPVHLPRQDPKPGHGRTTEVPEQPRLQRASKRADGRLQPAIGEDVRVEHLELLDPDNGRNRRERALRSGWLGSCSLRGR
jgi:hypothetical protein